MTIIGRGAVDLTISGGGAIQIAKIAAGKSLSISGCTFANGKATNYANGAAIENHGLLTVSACVLSNNQITGGWGGAVFNDGGLTLIDTAFSGNIATGENGYYGEGERVPVWAGPSTLQPVLFRLRTARSREMVQEVERGVRKAA